MPRTLAALSMMLTVSACTPTVEGRDFQVYETRALSMGLLRTDRRPDDAPFSNQDLVRNFELVTFHLEAGINEGSTDLDRLQRWEEPVRWWLRAEPEEARAIRDDIEATFARLARVTGLDIAEAESDEVSNLDIIVPVADTYDDHIAWARRLIGQDYADRIEWFRPRTFPCAVRLSVREHDDEWGPAGSVGYALVMIRGGFSPSYRLGCVEEELAQAIGPANDDDSVRPSVFNDDEEFALLTEHDEYLLRALYHPRFSAGMPKAEAMALLPGVFDDLRPGE